MKLIVTFSGGKDSLASLLWVRNNLTKGFVTVFCDTGWEHPLTHKHIADVAAKLDLNLVTLRSRKYAGMAELAAGRKRFPSTRARFCTSELKIIPMVDYLLDEVGDNFMMVQGIRAAESASRALMAAQCDYFKFYKQPYGVDKKGKPKYHTYRRREVLEFCKTHATDVLRPVFEWSAQQVIDYIVENGIEPNSLYKMGYKRVGCYPCIMASQRDILNMSRQDPARIEQIAGLERQIGSSFFGPDKIPARYIPKGRDYPLIGDVVRYIEWQNSTGDLFDDSPATSCMSFYGLCE